jgi:DegV family protein with EDD domain
MADGEQAVSVRVVTDSAAALEPEVIEAYGVQVVPLTVTAAGEAYADGELPDDELERRIAAGRVTTSSPPPGAFVAAIEAEGGDDGVVIVTMAQALSTTNRAAQMAAGTSERPVRVVDSGSAAGAQALVVMAAVTRSREGGDVEDVAAAAKEAASQVRLIGTLGSLDRLVASGRVPGIAGAAGRMLGVNPVFELRDGRVRPHLPALSREAALDRLVGVWRDSRLRGTDAQVVVSHALAADAADALLKRVTAEVDPQVAVIGSFGAALLAHAGPGTVGLSWRWA